MCPLLNETVGRSLDHCPLIELVHTLTHARVTRTAKYYYTFAALANWCSLQNIIRSPSGKGNFLMYDLPEGFYIYHYVFRPSSSEALHYLRSNAIKISAKKKKKIKYTYKFSYIFLLYVQRDIWRRIHRYRYVIPGSHPCNLNAFFRR